MFRFQLPIPIFCVISLLLCAANSVNAGVMLSDVKVNGTINATAAYGVIAGNDGGLLGFLNSDSIPMFAAGTPVNGLTWSFLGKSDETNGGPFMQHFNETTETLELDSPLFTSGVGNIAISLKAGPNYSVYVFKDVSNVNTFLFNTQALLNNGGNVANLSHASLFTAESEPNSTGNVPEPSSIMIWGLGMLILTRKRCTRNAN